jgi:hypothetical protein
MADGLKRLDVEKTEIKTGYCISNELRDRQIRVAIDRIPERLQPSESLFEDEIAIVCYGPSLNKTWPALAGFKKIMTCSGAHKYLIDKGIIPTWHVDLDPREHKVKMLGRAHSEVQYLMASTCHPSMWDVLEGHRVKLWHIFNGEDYKEVPLNYPQGDWIFTGGNNVGVRCLAIARVLGYHKLHVFGMDYSFPKHDSHHASVHMNASKKIYETPFGGKMYYCEPVMIEYARQFFHEINQLPDVKVILHGEGLLQHMVYARRNDKVEVKKHSLIAFSTPKTITQETVALYRKLHLNPLYGIEGRKRKDVVIKLAESLKTRSVMDYGCGKSALAASLPFPIWEYDPAIPGKDAVPRPADLVLCFNVLECVEPDMMDNVLGDLTRCSKVCVFAIIEIQNDHNKEWWSAKLREFFKIATILQSGNELHCVLEPRKMGPRA